MSRDTRLPSNFKLPNPGPYLAKVVGHLDSTFQGALEVQLIHPSANDDDISGQLFIANYLSPFAGQTNIKHITRTDNYNETQKSYGFWMVPPDPGVIVVVIFINSDESKCYWLGCVPDLNMNFMVPGLAATELATDKKTDKGRVPVAEYNKLVNEGKTINDGTQVIKPASPLEKTLDEQGLLEDDARGITTSSARREVPSSVFGMNTPGPIDKVSGKKGEVGKVESRLQSAFVSRLPGSTFVMDDGDSRWERKKTPWEGPPEYADVVAGETGLRDRPHNELIRLRTRTGHQILLHNSEDLIYIGNSRGTAWIELTSDGKIDVFATDSINFHTKQDFNFFVDRDFNLEIGRNCNIKIAEELHIETNTEKRIVNSTQDINVIGNVKKIYEGTYQREVFKTTDFKFIGNVTERIDANHRTKTAGTSTNFVMGSHSLKVKGTRSLTVEGSNLVFTGGSSIQTTKGSFNVSTTGSNNFTTSSSTNIRSGGAHIESASVIHMNGPGAASAASTNALPDYKVPITIPIPVPLKTHKLPGHTGDIEFDTILRRVTTREPYPHHENLDPEKFKPTNLDRDVKRRYENDSEDGRKPGTDNEP